MEVTTLTAAEAIQVGNFAKRGGVDHMTIDIRVQKTILRLYDAGGNYLGTVIMSTDGKIISDSQAK